MRCGSPRSYAEGGIRTSPPFGSSEDVQGSRHHKLGELGRHLSRRLLSSQEVYKGLATLHAGSVGGTALGSGEVVPSHFASGRDSQKENKGVQRDGRLSPGAVAFVRSRYLPTSLP
jgi:hypothetical protein